jgi:Transposase
MHVTTIGLDIAKNVFQVHGIDSAEKVVVRKQLRRGQVMAFFEALAPCLVGMEACATAHHWARELTKFGHEVRLMPAKDVKAYVKRNKNDAADAEAICEAVRQAECLRGPISVAQLRGRTRPTASEGASCPFRSPAPVRHCRARFARGRPSSPVVVRGRRAPAPSSHRDGRPRT